MIASVLGVQVPLLIVHTKVFTPVVKPVTPLVGLVGVVTAPVPAVTVQSPVPTVGVFAAKVAVELQMVWSAPAAAAVCSMNRSIVADPRYSPEMVSSFGLNSPAFELGDFRMD